MKNLKGVMDSVQRLVRHLSRVPDAYRPPGELCNREDYVFWTFNSRLGALTLREPEADMYVECFRGMRKLLSPKGEWSDDELSNRLRDLVVSTLRDARRSPEALERNMGEALAEMKAAFSEKPKLWESLFPVVGFNRDCLPYDFGRVSLQDGAPLAHELVADAPCADEDGVDLVSAVRRHAKTEVESKLGKAVVARTTVRAFDRDAARALALRDVLQTLDIINFFADLYRPSAYRARVVIASELPDGRLESITREVGGMFPGGVGSEVTGRLDDVWLPPLDSDDAAEFGLAATHELLRQPSRTDASTRTLAALQWAGRAGTERRAEQALLDHAIALETLLLGPAKGGELTFRLKVRASHVAGQLDPGSRRPYAAEIEEFYELRSKVVHQGHTGVSRAEVQYYGTLAKQCIIAALKTPAFLALRSSKEIDEWLDEKVYA